MSKSPNGRGALFAGGLAAILASTCCLGPLILVALGFSGAWIRNLTALEPYRPIFIGVALVAMFSLGGEFSDQYKPASQTKSARSHRYEPRTRSFSGSICTGTDRTWFSLCRTIFY